MPYLLVMTDKRQDPLLSVHKGQLSEGRQHWLVIVGLVAALTHGLALLAEYPPSNDAQEYKALGIALAESGELRLPTGELAKRMPLYPSLIAAVYKWQPRELWESGFLILQTIIAFATTLFIAVLAKCLADNRAGTIAGCIAALYAPFRLLQVSFLTETLFIFLFSAALLLYVNVCLQHCSVAKRLVALAGVSLLIGLSILTRANAILLLVPFAVDTVLRAGSAGQRAARVSLLLIPAILCAGAWTMRNHDRLGKYTLSTIGGLNFYIGHNPHYAEDPGLADADYAAFDRLRTEERLSEVEADRRLFREGIAFIRAHPAETCRNAITKTGVWLRSTVAISAPSLALIILFTLLRNGWGSWRAGRLVVKRHLLYLVVLVAFFPVLIYWASELYQTYRPWTSPLFVVPVGIFSLLFLRCRVSVRGLFIGLLASQMLVALVFIPLARLRWSIDTLFIVAIGVGISRLCLWLSPREEIETPSNVATHERASP